MTELVLVRHAHADWSPDEARSLSTKGRKDAERLAKRLVRRTPTDVFSSPYARARETVEPLAACAGVPVRIDDDLRERTLAATRVDDFQAAVAATWHDFDFVHPGGESNRAAQKRVVAAVSRILGQCRGGRVVVATHGNVLALYLNSLDSSVGLDFWADLKMPDAFVLLDPMAAAPRYERVTF